MKIRNIGPINEEVEMNFEVAENMEPDAYEVEMPDGRRLLKLAYIYGANASGKTTVLKAFDLLRKLLLKPVTDKSSELAFEPFLFRQSPYDETSFLELAFYVDGLRYIYDLTFDKQYIVMERLVAYHTAKPTEIFSRSTDANKRLAKISFGSKIKASSRDKDLLESNTLHNNTVLGAYAKTNVDIPELEQLNRWFTAFLMGMVTSETDLTESTAVLMAQDKTVTDWINLFLNKADQQISRVEVYDATHQESLPLHGAEIINFKLPDNGSSRSTVRKTGKTNASGHGATITSHFMFGAGLSQRKIEFIHDANGQQYTLSMLKESSGTKRYFGLGGVLYDIINNPRLLCIDELETSLHPDLMKHFLQTYLLNSANSQLLITTHNTGLIAEQDFIRRDALWFSEKQDDGSMRLYSAADFDSTTLRKDASLINAYKAGRLGAKPNLGSPYLEKQ